MTWYHVETYEENKGIWTGFLQEPCLFVSGSSRAETRERAEALLQEVYGGEPQVVWID